MSLVSQIIIINLILIFFQIVFFFIYLLNYNRFNTVKPKCNWIERKSEHIPNCELIHAELLTFNGKTKILWRKNPNDLDFSNDALEPIISYMVVRDEL